MHPQLQFQLTRFPRLYEFVLDRKGRATLEKIVFLSLVRPGDVVVEVGANRGHYTILFSHLTGPEGRVHAFEPVPPTYRKLTDYVVGRKRFDNFTLNNAAAGDTLGSVELYMPDEDDGQSSMAQHNQGSWENVQAVTKYDCQVTTLDHYAETNFAEKLDFIKIDAEGAEMLVLKGAAATLKRYQPLVHLEVSHAWAQTFGYQPADIVHLLQGLGYTSFFKVDDTVVPITNPSQDLSREHVPGSANMICISHAHHLQRVERLVKKYSA